jgi:hypothetical protein
MSFQPTPAIGEGDEYELRGDAPRIYSLEHDAKIVGWRAECFEGAGLTPLQAQALAVRRDVDRVVVENMLKAGRTGAQIISFFAAS